MGRFDFLIACRLPGRVVGAQRGWLELMEEIQLCEKLPCGCHPLLYALVSPGLTVPRHYAPGACLRAVFVHGLRPKINLVVAVTQLRQRASEHRR
jgi:hypothetical protein